ncbi:OX-2 membrane glycoprotein [Nothobranchius furzeri]|uniref:OX-2 membrane glycoprotein-like n=2 Tax=Nothobranchius furzeri TaxID=105023 RepID=A0A9D2Y6Y5_NOTFU|nr:OX-2 membrane glycoprotein [Nothobranchius furzeri]XP_054598990.1 OX-2 membrane glycoprotein [Nothobranchius furzeri]KAF7214708.1 OX-2 membrane glycoprotein-like [Nothobranchius furzeri]
MIVLLVGILLASKASSSQISGHGSSTVEFGGNASFTCTVAPTAGVLQVTWQRPSGEAIENLATFSKQFGEQVNEPYRGKLSFTEKSLNSSSITLRNVTWEDEGCYVCAFNVFPEGSKRKQFCLTVQGISKVSTSHIPTNRPNTEFRQEVFSCSATGKPAPSISWDVSPGAETPTEPQTSTVSNGDGTVTSSSSITLGIAADWTGTVDCLLNKEKRGGKLERVFSYRREEQKENRYHHISIIITLVMFISLTVVSAVVIRHRLKKKQERRDLIP